MPGEKTPWSVVATVRKEASDAEKRATFYSASASTHSAIELPPGTSLVGFRWSAMAVKVVMHVYVADSAAGTYVPLRRSDDSGTFKIYGADSASAAGSIMIPDAAPFRHIKIIMNKSLATKKVFGFIVKG